MNTYYYQQVCGLLGLLKTNGADLNWSAIDSEMRQVSQNGTAEQWATNCHRKYRDMVLSRGLLKNGEVTSHSDVVPLV